MIHVWALGFLGNDGCTCGYRCQRGKGLWRKFCCAISCLCVIKYPEEFCCVHRVALAKSPRRWNLPATSVTFSYKAKLCSSWVSPDLQQHERGAGCILPGVHVNDRFWIPPSWAGAEGSIAALFAFPACTLPPGQSYPPPIIKTTFPRPTAYLFIDTAPT